MYKYMHAMCWREDEEEYPYHTDIYAHATHKTVAIFLFFRFVCVCDLFWFVIQSKRLAGKIKDNTSNLRLIFV